MLISRRRLIFFLALLPAFVHGMGTSDYLGKTPFQVVRMGQSRWYDYGMGLKISYNITPLAEMYCSAQRRVIDYQLRTASTRRKSEIADLRHRLRAIANDAVTLGEIETGGGSMWTEVAAGLTADVEDVVASWITNAPAPKSPTEDQVEFLLSWLEVHIQNREAEIQWLSRTTSLNFKQVLSVFRRFRDEIRSLRSVKPTLSSRESAILSVFASMAVRLCFSEDR